MTGKSNLKGIFTVVPTPLKEDEALDLKGLRHLLNFYIDSGCHGLLVLGSGGEFPYFTFEERIQVAREAVKAVKGRVPLLVGTGFTGMTEAAAFVKEAGLLDIDGLLVILPIYHPVPFEDAHAFYSHICRVSRKPVLYYHYPQMTELFYTPRQIGRLFAIPNMAGAKESSLNLCEMAAHQKELKGRDFAVFTGNSLSLLRALDMGACGTICQIPSFAPRLVVDCYDAWAGGNGTKARELQERITRLLPFLNTFDLPTGLQVSAYKLLSRLPVSMKERNRSRHAVVKETLRQLGHPISARVRSPLPQVTPKLQEQIGEHLKAAGIA